MRLPTPPAGLSAESRKMWNKLLTELGEWEDSQLWIVRTGLEQWDLMQQARAELARDGLMVPDRFGQLKPHPLASVVRDCASGVRQTYKLLGLDLEHEGE